MKSKHREQINQEPRSEIVVGCLLLLIDQLVFAVEIRTEEIQDYVGQKENTEQDRDKQPGEVIIEVEEGK